MSDKNEAVDQRIEDLLSQLTLEEKVSLLSGKDAWNTVPIERLGIPSVAMTDGPHGVRADNPGAGRISDYNTSFPTGVSMASSWNPELIERVGVALGDETRAMGCDILLGPCVNIMRTPLAGRNFESLSEDPYLAGRIGIAVVKGIQSRNIGTSLKHYACNNQEIERFRGSSEIDERTLREIYLPAFEAIVKETQPWTVMCSYNRINGVYASENEYLLTRILRNEWGFDGAVVSDWGANHTIVESVKAGLDLEMPGPALYYGDLLDKAVQNWQVDEAVIDTSVRRILRLIIKSGKMDTPPVSLSGSANTPEHQALARELAEESIILLKNDNAILPFSGVKKLAVIGPNANEARIGGGGSSYVEPPYRVSPLEGLRTKLGKTVEITYAQGCANYEEPPVLRGEHVRTASDGERGLLGQYFNNPDFSGEADAQRVDIKLGYWRINPPTGVAPDLFSVRWTGKLTAPETGRYVFKLVSSGVSRFYVDGALLLETTPEPDIPFEFPGYSEVTYVELEEGREYDVKVEYIKSADTEHRAIYVKFASAPEPDERLYRAVKLARQSDMAIIFGGMPMGWEREGTDRPHMALPGNQDVLIEAVVQANPYTVVVLNCGSPVEMPWIDHVPAVILALYPGQEGGNALANILLGDVNPSGKLSVTFPKRYADNPTFINYPGTKEVRYGEGIFVGYRYYDKKDIEPLFPFGYGLSYTTFEYSDLQIPETVKAEESINLSVTITNTGDRAGKEVVQLYVRDKESSLVRPLKELKGFAKILLAPGESKAVSFVLDQRALSFYDPYQKQWVAEPGEFEILIGASSHDIRARATVTLLD